jgi:hypothetical protein
MHELSIAMNVVELARGHSRLHGDGRISAVTLRIGRLSCVHEDSLRYSFELVTEGTPLAGALAGVAAEFGVIMLLYLKQAWEARLACGADSDGDLLDAIREGAVLRVRPKAMTVAVIIAGLVPIMFGGGTGSEVMQRIAAPMVGGMVTAPLLSMFIVPAIYRLMRRRRRSVDGSAFNEPDGASMPAPAQTVA